ncbi:AbrB/MazE/SpoVT family DNA-binding domain-containing protein [Pseudorhodoplanes sp.]|uniref:AbrB/MazE/SpoVT family DNA-binding domain-containing protein n=1 Tax=Pseudorhodoplanes sp. TaxID=1934341 RepID=UPI0039199871
MRVKVAKWGNSLGLRLPKAAVEAAGLQAGSEVDVTVEGRELRVRPPSTAKTSKSLLQEMLAEIDRLGPGHEPETVDWGPDVGSEIIDDEYSRGKISLDDILSGPPQHRNTTRNDDKDGSEPVILPGSILIRSSVPNSRDGDPVLLLRRPSIT